MTDAGQQTGDEHALAVHQAAFAGEIARGDRAVDAAQPELPDIEMLAFVVAERVGNRRGQDQFFYLLHAENRYRVVDGVDLRGETEIGAVDDAQHARGHARVVDDQLRDIL